MSVSGGLTLFSFTIQDPATMNINKALDIMKSVACGAEKMYRGIAADPPDDNFGVIAVPDPLDIGPLTPGSLDTAVRSVDLQRAFGEAALHAFERYQGAVAAGDEDAQIAQLRAAGENAQLLADEMGLSADALGAWASDAASDSGLAGVILPSGDAAPLAALYQRIVDDGFTAEEIAEFHAVGYTDDDIAAIRTHASLGIEEIPLDTSYPDALLAVADDLRAGAEAVADFASDANALADGLDANNPPTASFTRTPASGSPPLDVTFTNTSEDPDDDTLAHSWDFGDGQTSSEESPVHTYARIGTYTASLTVSDGDATDTAQATITVRAANTPPAPADDFVSTIRNTSVDIDVLANDFDQDFDPLSITAVSDPPHGAVACPSAGPCAYTPIPTSRGPTRSPT